jgi:hypothetical protein
MSEMSGDSLIGLNGYSTGRGQKERDSGQRTEGKGQRTEAKNKKELQRAEDK